MRADDASPTYATNPSHGGDAQRSDLLYEFEMELRRVAKTLTRSHTPPALLLIARETARGKSTVTTFTDSGLRGWMIGSRLTVLTDGGWVPHTTGRMHKLDKPRHSRLFGDATTREYSENWQVLTDVGVKPGALYISLGAGDEAMLNVCRDPRRAEIFSTTTIAGTPHLVFHNTRGTAGAQYSVLVDDLQRWLQDYH